MTGSFTSAARSALVLSMRHDKHPEVGGLIPVEGLIKLPYVPASFALCLDCGKFWGNISLDKLYDDVGWHMAGYPKHIVHVWDD